MHSVPSLICNEVVSSNGTIFISWTLIQDGGHNLTKIIVAYTVIIDDRIKISGTIPSITTMDRTASIVLPLTGKGHIAVLLVASTIFGSITVDCPLFILNACKRIIIS